MHYYYHSLGHAIFYFFNFSKKKAKNVGQILSLGEINFFYMIVSWNNTEYNTKISIDCFRPRLEYFSLIERAKVGRTSFTKVVEQGKINHKADCKVPRSHKKGSLLWFLSAAHTLSHSSEG